MTESEFPRMVEILQPSEKGVAKIDHITVSREEADFGNMRASFSPGGSVHFVDPGQYARLQVDGQLTVTDTQMEQRTNAEFLWRAHGRVLIAGLGLGMIIHAAMKKPAVKHITVLEKYQDVIDLVAPSLEQYGDRLTITNSDAITWALPKGAMWEVIYFDIWPTICENNLETAAKLSRHYSRRLNRKDPEAWMGGWMVEYLRQERRYQNRNCW